MKFSTTATAAAAADDDDDAKVLELVFSSSPMFIESIY